MSVMLHKEGESHLKSLIDAGEYDVDADWSFSAEDGDKLLGDKGDDWVRYGSVHLGENTSEADMTKARWEYPAAKVSGDSEKVFRSGLIAAKQRAAQQGETEIENAAGRLVDMIDEMEGKDDETGEAKPDQEAKSAAGLRRTLARGRDLPRVMTRIFGAPLMIAPAKLDVIMRALGPRLGLLVAPLQKNAMEDDEAGPVVIGADMGDDDGDEDSAPYAITDDGLALIAIEGTLVYKTSWLGALSGLTSYSSIGDNLGKALADPVVRGIMLCIDSYGGEVNGCFDLADAIYAARSQKPVYAVAADDAMSAAYALGSAATKLYVSRTSGVGSIGVVALHIDESAADKADGLKYTYIASGARKTDGNPHEPLSDTARETMQAEVDRVRALFAGSVAKYRGLSVDQVMGTEAAVYFGDNAIGAKLADAVGTPADALAALRASLELARSSVGALPGTSPAVAAATPPAKAAPASVVDLDAVRAKVRGETAADYVEIAELCALAKRPELAAEFIRAGKTISAVREEIQRLRADASDARQVSGHILADAGTNSAQEVSDSWDRAFAAARPQSRRT